MSFRIIESLNVVDYLIIILLTFLLYLFRFYYNYFTRPNPLPGPLPLPFRLESHFFDGNIRRFAAELCQKYGDICEFRLGGHRRILVSKQEYIEDLLSPSRTVFIKHENSQALDMLGIVGRGMFFNNDYDIWKINKYFLLQSISTHGFNEEAIKRTIELFEKLNGYWNSLKKTLSCNDEWFEMDLLPWIKSLMTDNISIIITGERGCSMAKYYDTFNSNKSKIETVFDDPIVYDSDKFSRTTSAHIKGTFSLYDVYPFLLRYVPFFKNKANAILKDRDYILKTLGNMIEKRRFDFANSPQKLKSKHDLLTLLITANNDAKKSKMIESLTNEDISALLYDASIAGAVTASNTLCYAIYYICCNPHVKQKMFDEIDSVFPNNSSDKLCLTSENLAKLRYCESIIKEALRLTHVVPVLKRVSSAERKVAGYTWPSETVFHLNHAGMHIDEKYFVNPTAFDPDRFYLQNDLSELNDDLGNFDKENNKPINKKCSLIIFGRGMRLCPEES
ncbi:cytochrome P450 [Gigaspora rosea]|uniref:Cytochrome P450 n=1 Tax=Gigaspora rosea TaxID=44941 RepID=A0A397W4V7_9GLOM|nr:cytochrome P450 [Gigaspora rosea]